MSVDFSASLPDQIESHFRDGELVAAIAQDVLTKEVLMLAWMNREALQTTLETGYATYWSRSRNSLWKKGESSGHVQRVHSIHFDCDGDALLIQIHQDGVACHTGERSCFHNALDVPRDASKDGQPS